MNEAILCKVCIRRIPGGGCIECVLEEGERVLPSSIGSVIKSDKEGGEREYRGCIDCSRLARERMDVLSGGESEDEEAEAGRAGSFGVRMS